MATIKEIIESQANAANINTSALDLYKIVNAAVKEGGTRRDIHHGEAVIGIAIHPDDRLIVRGRELPIVCDFIHSGPTLSNQ